MVNRVEDIKKRIENFPIYKRSPRLILEPPTDAVEIKKPAQKAKIGKSSLVQIILTPVVMLAVTVGIGLLLKRGMYMMIGVASTIVTSIFSVCRFFTEKKECKEKNERREQIYTEYLLEKRKEIFNLRKKEIESYEFNSPVVSQVEKMINEYSSRIYEKSITDADFLTLTVGYYDDKSSCPIKYDFDELKIETDELEIEAKELADEYTIVKDKPLVIDLKNAHLGLVGPKNIIHEQLHILISKLCVVQSYHDLQILFLVNQEDSRQYKYLQWYPHTQIEAIGTGGLIDNGAVADQILLSMHKIIKERQLAMKEDGKEGGFKPYFLFIIDEPKLMSDHIIMEYLSKDESFGYSLIYTSSMQENLPENVGTIIKYKDSDNARLVMNEKVLQEQDFRLDRIGDVNLEWMARNLSVLVHEQGLVMHLPESVSFFEMYDVQHPSQMNILDRWKNNSSNKSLAVPLGIRVTGEKLMLNLHEKAHGPHGLIAGTTGSGKSEIIQSYILSLAANFHPYEVGFLLIDFKGGGMSHLFENLPHVLGTITNLDADSSMRALASIDSEMKRRQRIFMENDVNHINGYVSLFKEGVVAEPLPHLFIISDEFAELKKEQPEFMTQLVSTARLGRSLGIHLILATQKPSGVVTDQIWSNSRFKLALKVQDEQDSKQIIKTSDAAYIRNPGRAYLQVGINEIYELFQSAYSGALCSEDSYEEFVDDRVYVRNHLGQMELLNEDLSKGEAGKEKLKKQLDVTVEYIKILYDSLECTPVARPWLPPMEDKVASPIIKTRLERLSEIGEQIYENENVVDLSVELGLIDLPKQQKISTYVYDLRKAGNLLLYSAPGYGKSMTLTTMILTMALKSSPALLNFYILDLGSGGLLPLRNLPHCSDYMGFDDAEKLTRFMQIIEDEIKIRKQLFSAAFAMNFDMYNRNAECKLPAIVWFIDNFDIGKEMDQNLEMTVSHVARDGMNLGIYVIVSASRPGAIRFSVINNFKSAIALYMYDKADTTSAVGKPEYGVKEIRGRALVKLEDTTELQIYTPLETLNDDIYIDNLKQEINLINECYKGKRPRRIPVLPKEFSVNKLKEFANDWNVKDVSLIPIGLDVESVDLACVDIRNKRQLLIGGPSTGKTNLLKVILRMKDADLKTYVVDDKSLELQSISHLVGARHISSPTEYIEFFGEMNDIIENRKRLYLEEKEKNSSIIPGRFYSKLDPMLVIISDMDAFIGNISLLNDSKLYDIMVELEEVNISIIALSLSNNRMRNVDSFTKVMKETIDGIVVGNPAAQGMFVVPRSISNDNTIGICYTIHRNQVVKILTPKYE